MQYRQPMHRLLLTRTTPSSVLYVADTGHTWTHGALSPWLQSFGTKKLLAPLILRYLMLAASDPKPWIPPSGESTYVSPFSSTTYRSTHVRLNSGSSGTSFSCLQAS